MIDTKPKHRIEHQHQAWYSMLWHAIAIISWSYYAIAIRLEAITIRFPFHYVPFESFLVSNEIGPPIRL